MAKPTILVVGADKGGVGKTTVSRVMMDYYKANDIPVRAFDTQAPNGNLQRFFADRTQIVDLTDPDGQMAVFDGLDTSAVTLIDVCAGLLTPSLKLFADLGLMRMVRENTATVAVLHVIGSTVESFNEIKATAEALAGAKHFVIANHMTDAKFFDGINGVDKEALNRATVIHFPKLVARAAEHADVASLPFSKFAVDTAQSFTMRGLVGTWLADCYQQLDIAKLNAL